MGVMPRTQNSTSAFMPPSCPCMTGNSSIRSWVFLLDAPPFRLPSLSSPLPSPLLSSSAAFVPSRRRPRLRSFPAGFLPRWHPPSRPSTTAVNCCRHRSWPQRAAATCNSRRCLWLLRAPPPILVGAPVGGRPRRPVLSLRYEADRCLPRALPPPPVFPFLVAGMRGRSLFPTRSDVPMMLPLRLPWRRGWARLSSDEAARSVGLLGLRGDAALGAFWRVGREGGGQDGGMCCMGGCEGRGAALHDEMRGTWGYGGCWGHGDEQVRPWTGKGRVTMKMEAGDGRVCGWWD